ncbi:uncharacterized protein LOC135486833 [Lineus longissimus]|uniref:uncharacterized protein LOC135486833 n=1 Tax=Lineus longissimus TaxID=88925 RepID=UPI00315CC64B
MDSGLGSEEEIPLLSRPSLTPRGHSWPNACLLLLLFVQTLGLYQVDEVGKHDRMKFFQHNELPGQRSWLLILAVMLYILPLAIAIFTDTITGRRCAICIGLGLKTSGSLILFIVILLFESLGNLDQMAVKSLTGAYGFGGLLFIVGMMFLLPGLMAFTADQVEQTPGNVSSNMRWVCWTSLLALAALDGLFALQPPSLEEHRYYQTIRHAIMFGSDAISITMFLFLRSGFNISIPARASRDNAAEATEAIPPTGSSV